MYYAQIKNGIVVFVIVADAKFIAALPDKDDWVLTDYDTRGGIHFDEDGKPDGGVALRGNYAGIGDTYDKDNDIFVGEEPPRQETASWVLNISTATWELIPDLED